MPSKGSARQTYTRTQLRTLAHVVAGPPLEVGLVAPAQPLARSAHPSPHAARRKLSSRTFARTLGGPTHTSVNGRPRVRPKNQNKPNQPWHAVSARPRSAAWSRRVPRLPKISKSGELRAIPRSPSAPLLFRPPRWSGSTPPLVYSAGRRGRKSEGRVHEHLTRFGRLPDMLPTLFPAMPPTQQAPPTTPLPHPRV